MCARLVLSRPRHPAADSYMPSSVPAVIGNFLLMLEGSGSEGEAPCMLSTVTASPCRLQSLRLALWRRLGTPLVERHQRLPRNTPNGACAGVSCNRRDSERVRMPFRGC